MDHNLLATSTGPNLCLGVSPGTDFSSAAFTPLAQYACPDLSFASTWTWTKSSTLGYFTATDQTGKYCLAFDGVGALEVDAVGVSPCTGDNNQQFQIIQAFAGYNIRAVNSNSLDRTVCIGVDFASSDIGASVKLWVVPWADFQLCLLLAE